MCVRVYVCVVIELGRVQNVPEECIFCLAQVFVVGMRESVLRNKCRGFLTRICGHLYFMLFVIFIGT